MQNPEQPPGPTQVGDVAIFYNAYVQDTPAALAAEETLRSVTLSRKYAMNYFRLQKSFPGAYPPLEIEVAACKILYDYVQPKYMVAHAAIQNIELVDRMKYIESDIRLIIYSFLEVIVRRIKSLGPLKTIRYIEQIVERNPKFPEGNAGMFIHSRLILNQESLTELLHVMTPGWKEAKQAVDNLYNEAGFHWRYFMYYNDNHPLARIYNGEIPLRPDTFEMGTTLDEVLEYEDNMTDLNNHEYWRMKTRPLDDPRKPHAADRIIAPFLGWRKEALVNAIRTSGLLKTFVKPGWGGPASYEGLLRADLGLISVPPPPGDPKWKHPNTDWKYITGFDDNSGRNRNPDRPTKNLHTRRPIFYMTIYRRIFGTLDSLKWGAICSNDLIPLDKLRYLAETHTGIKFDDSNMQDICATLLDFTAKRKAMQIQITKDLEHQISAVMYQPNTPWLNPIYGFEFKDGGTAITNSYEQYMYIKALCENEAVDVEGLRLKIARARMNHLIPGGYEEATKEQICGYLLDHLEYQAQKYESIAFDCSDPAIRKRHIINTLNIMEMGDVFKNVDLEKATKEDLCRIVTKYLAALMEQRALKLAE
jgi:hypothetical protein